MFDNRTFLFSFALFLTIELAVVHSEDCPELYKRYSRKHSYCLPPSTCNVLKSGVTAEDRDAILKRHNELRSKVAMGKEGSLPQASDMLQMDWDAELASIAQKYVMQCIYDHDCGSCRQTVNYAAGQNMAQATTSAPGALDSDWKGIVDMWYNEVKDFNPSAIDAFTSFGHTGTIGHFTQVVWAKSWKIGCGYSSYRNGGTTYGLYACNYGPGGNMGGAPIYISGTSCAKCPENACCGSACSKTPNYEGLCQITGNGGPKYPRDPKFIAYCNFDEGNSDCARQLASGVDGWKVTNTLSGPFIGIVLNGGEKSTLKFTKGVEAISDNSCLRITYRMGPNVDGERSSGKAQGTVVDSTGYDFNMKFSPTTQLMPYGMSISWKSTFQLSLTFEVPAGSPKQYFEVSEISFRDGQC